jgi:hypothetical protein|tara:strand:+ start:228 stop:377 length:150 start_codon:yes stop_codon:yes gene_type:complete
MAGKKSKKKAPVKPETKVNSTSTFEAKLSDTVKRMGEIIKGNDQRHHLK